MLETIRVCTRCKLERHIEQFELIKGKNFARRRVCYSCRSTAEKSRPSHSGALQRTYDSRALSRINPERRAKHISEDMARFDRRQGWTEHVVAQEWIEAQISKPCSYCHQQLGKLDMTLDRIDNNLGHFEENLVPACQSCNYFRRDMPYEAWLILAQNMPAIVNSGLLDDWSAGAGFRGKIKRRKVA